MKGQKELIDELINYVKNQGNKISYRTSTRVIAHLKIFKVDQGDKNMRLNQNIMESILYLQSYKRYLIRKMSFYKNINWFEELKKEFYNPEFKTDIIKCDGNFDMICDIEITDEMCSTLYDELGKFEIHLFREKQII